MGRKKLNIAGVRNELEASAFFSPPPAPAPAKEQTAEAINDTTKHRLNERTVERTVERPKVRHTFDIFADQVTSLKRIQLERAEMSDKRYRMGDLVQEALDSFIAKQRSRD